MESRRSAGETSLWKRSLSTFAAWSRKLDLQRSQAKKGVGISRKGSFESSKPTFPSGIKKSKVSDIRNWIIYQIFPPVYDEELPLSQGTATWFLIPLLRRWVDRRAPGDWEWYSVLRWRLASVGVCGAPWVSLDNQSTRTFAPMRGPLAPPPGSAGWFSAGIRRGRPAHAFLFRRHLHQLCCFPPPSQFCFCLKYTVMSVRFLISSPPGEFPPCQEVRRQRSAAVSVTRVSVHNPK